VACYAAACIVAPGLRPREITIADYFGACMVTIGDLVGCDLSV
jgi:hypothetical protein